MKVFAVIMFIICIVDIFVCFACCAIDEGREDTEYDDGSAN